MAKSEIHNSSELLQAIGAVSIEVANLENTFGTLLAAMLMAPESVGRVIFLTPKSAMGRLELIDNLAREIDQNKGPYLKEISPFTKRAKAIFGKRHAIIHDFWQINPDNKTTFFQQPLPVKTGSTPTLTKLSELHKVVDDAIKLREEINPLIGKWKKRRFLSLKHTLQEQPFQSLLRSVPANQK